MCTTREEKGCSFKVSTLSEKHLVTHQSFTGLEKKAHLNQTAEWLCLIVQIFNNNLDLQSN